jgi:hypothetical protein
MGKRVGGRSFWRSPHAPSPPSLPAHSPQAAPAPPPCLLLRRPPSLLDEYLSYTPLALLPLVSLLLPQGPQGPMEEEMDTQLDAAQTQLDADSPGPPPVSEKPPEKPWARLIGIGPTAAFGVFHLHNKQVVFGNAKKNPGAPIRIDDPRVRCVLSIPSQTPSCLPCAAAAGLCPGPAWPLWREMREGA